MDAPYQASPDVHVLPSNFALPGVGVLPINAYVLLAEEPVLIDTGLAVDRADFLAALSSVIDPAALRWVWLTHDDADHTGNIEAVMELAPGARLATPAFAALRMGSWWPVPFDRVYAIRPGDEIPLGDRTLRAVQPPLYDNPMSTGFVDGKTGALFSVDAFGALLPEATQNAADVPPEALAGGMAGWATSDSPWSHLVDRERYHRVLDGVRRLQPSHIFSSHLPAASGMALDQFLRVLEAVPDAEPFVGPNVEEFGHLIAAMTGVPADGTPTVPG
ncbi:MAG TPA: MBL fold metallo-hydrolase [Acidimicrobiales bacterium]|nr:MBL fold metallo-hydrolase [Acidimicrobiales bacterium]